MGNKILWSDENTVEDGHYVYRDTSTIDTGSLPTPIATLGADVEEYEDDDSAIVDGTTYYYRVAAYAGGHCFC